MSKWLETFKSIPSVQIVQKAQLAPPIRTNNTNCTGVKELLEELQTLNQRWQKACDLEQSGFFDGLKPEVEERFCVQLREIVQRAAEIWE